MVETGSITRAAEHLFVAQPALGLQIRQLENELGVPLLFRHSRGVQPTTAGKMLYQHANDILGRVEQARQEITNFAEAAKENLVLGITPGLAALLGGQILVEALGALPGIHLSLVEEMSYVLVDAVERDDIDVALAYEAPDRPALVRTPLLEEDMLFVVSATSSVVAANRDAPGEIELAEALGHPLVLASERDPTRQLIAAAAARLGCVLNIELEASSISAMKTVVTQGRASGIMPRGTVAAELDNGSLAALRIVSPALSRTLYRVQSARRQPLRAEAGIQRFVKRMVVHYAREHGDLVRGVAF